MINYGGCAHPPPVTEAPALEVMNLQVAHPGARQAALHDITLTVPTGSMVALVGPNGAGKSTFLKTVANLLSPEQGTVRVFGHRQGTCHHRIAYLPQRGEMDWDFPVSLERMVMSGRYVHLGWFRRVGQKDRQAVRTMLQRMALEDLADRQIGELSGGQQQRAMLARALVQNAPMLLLDEPFNAVDERTRILLTGVLKDLQNEGRTILMATHEPEQPGLTFDFVFPFLEGRLVGEEKYRSGKTACGH